MDNTTATIGAVWIWLALLSGGYARTRGRGAWTWFVWTLVFGPFAALLLVTWPAIEKRDLKADPLPDRVGK